MSKWYAVTFRGDIIPLRKNDNYYEDARGFADPNWTDVAFDDDGAGPNISGYKWCQLWKGQKNANIAAESARHTWSYLKGVLE